MTSTDQTINTSASLRADIARAYTDLEVAVDGLTTETERIHVIRAIRALIAETNARGLHSAPTD